jgi:hypothetical protein
MALQPWFSNVFKPLDMTMIQCYPHDVPKNSNKWLPNFFGKNDVSTKDHLPLFHNSLELYDT